MYVGRRFRRPQIPQSPSKCIALRRLDLHRFIRRLLPCVSEFVYMAVVLSKRVEEAEDRKADDSDGVVGGGR